MATQTIQLAIDYKGKRYSGIYSVSGALMIARIPGVGSTSAEVTGDEPAFAEQLLQKILQDAETSGMLNR